MKVILGDVCYPKSEAVIIPSNTKGVMSRGVSSRILKVGLSNVTKEIKQIITNNNITIGDCFSTGPGRMKRRGLQRIYYAVIKRFQNDFSSVFVVNNALHNALKQVINDGVESVAICGIGLDDENLEPKTVARITVEICNRYDGQIEISIIDDNKEFITEVNNFVKELTNDNAK